jgi:hypothetical protein
MNKQAFFEMFGVVMALLGIGIAYFAIYQGIRHDKYKRDLEHRERMQALELGRPLPGDLPWLSPLRIGFLLGLVVPVAALGFAVLATREVGFREEVWQTAGIVSTAALVCGSVVASIAGRQNTPAAQRFALDEKPRIEEDAYDVVSARG